MQRITAETKRNIKQNGINEMTASGKEIPGRSFFVYFFQAVPYRWDWHILIIGRLVYNVLEGFVYGRREGGNMTGFPMLPYWEFDRWIEAGRIRRIIDLRSPWQYEEERIKGSENIPYDEFWERMDEINPGEITVFCCERGAKSMVICRDLWRMGYEVADLAGGIVNYRGKYIDR